MYIHVRVQTLKIYNVDDLNTGFHFGFIVGGYT